MTQLTKNQTHSFVKVYTEGGKTFQIEATVRHDDDCGNGHNTFTITCIISEKNNIGWKTVGGGMQHDAIAKHFPNLIPVLKWHLTSTDGPMYYIENTVFHVKQGNLDYARSTAVWPEVTDKDLLESNLREVLPARLPALLVEFRKAVESLGFVY